MSDFAFRKAPRKQEISPYENSIRRSVSDDQIGRYHEGSPATTQEKELFDSVRSMRRQKAFEMPEEKMPPSPVLPGDA